MGEKIYSGMNCPRKTVIGWNGLSSYGARQISCAYDTYDSNFSAIATPGASPIEEADRILRDRIQWIRPNVIHSWASLGIEIPDLFIHTGWAYPHFNSLAREVRKGKGKVVGMFDNNWKGNCRQLLGGIYFRAFERKKFALAWVPGKSGRKLARYIGFKEETISEGMYGADPDIFKNHTSILSRKNQILYVGQLIHRKNVLDLLAAWKLTRRENPTWNLLIIGEGPLKEQIGKIEGVSILSQQKPEIIAQHMNESKFLILPSIEEHWGLVVHEASLCGCGLILSSAVGSARDLADRENSIIIRKLGIKNIYEALSRSMNSSNEFLVGASRRSVELAESFGPKRWINSLNYILDTV